MTHLLRRLWQHDEGQDIAEYAVMLAVFLYWWLVRFA
jgi:Flp pilus assembly pilin Flp